MDTVDRLVRLLDQAEVRASEAEHRAAQLARELADRPYAPVDPVDADSLARSLAEVANRQKIMAIKIHRQFTRYGLKESKDAVERYWPVPADVPA